MHGATPIPRPFLSAAAVLLVLLMPQFGAGAEPRADVGAGARAAVPGALLPDDVAYDPAVPTPASALGHPVGTRHVGHDRLVAYLRTLAEASDRVSLEVYGHTFEARPLLLLAITAPQNHERMETLLRERRRVLEGHEIPDQPVFVWLGHSVHGNEASGANSALLTAYHWAAARGSAVERLLRETVILVDPAINPDGIDRFASWVNSHRSRVPVTDRLDLEHDEPWPGGRTNHYWFDLNRDWLPLQLPESQGRIAAIQRWLPNVLTDHHEMGTDSTFFFQPGEPDRVHPLIPERNQVLQAEFGAAFAAALDRIGSLYYAREDFDDYYIGRGPTYLDFNGGVAMLFEQASARGHAQESVNGLVTFPFAIRNHFVAARTTVETAHRLRENLLEYQRQFYADAAELARADARKAYVFGGRDRASTHHLAEVAARHGIAVHRLARDLRADGRTFAAGTAFVVPLEQPQYRLIHGLFEIRNRFADDRFYDVSAWTLPLAFGLPWATLERGAWDPALLGARFGPAALPPGRRRGGDGAYALAFEWRGYYAPRALHRLLAAGAVPRIALEPFTGPHGHRFAAGTVVVARGHQPLSDARLEALFETIRTQDALDVHALGSGYSHAGPDLGSRNFVPVGPARVAALGDEGLSGYEVGALWHLLDQRWHVPLTILNLRSFRRADLDRYTALVLVDGDYGDLGEQDAARLRRWIEGGGTLIAQKGAVRWASAHGLTDVRTERLPDLPTPLPPNDARPPAEDRGDYGRFPALRGSQRIGGTILRADVDPTHPLAFGFPDREVPLFRRGTLVLRGGDAFDRPAVYAAQPLWSGYLPDGAAPRLAGATAIHVHALGEGRVVSLADDPAFRAFWYGTNRIMANAIFFGPLIDPATAR